MIKEIPSIETLLHKFHYDKEKGTLVWKNPPLYLSKLKDTMVGCLDKDGYRKVKINYRNFGVHRLIWFIEKETQPLEIDHINGDVLDNRIENLRASNSRLNQQNQKHHRTGRLVGATKPKNSQRWNSQITIKGKKKHLGSFNTELDAHKAYMLAYDGLYG